MAQLTIAVVIASLGRPDALAVMLDNLAAQTRPPARTIFSVTSERDLPDGVSSRPGVECVSGPKGLPAQRNAGLDHLGTACDIVVFYDDDYVPSRFSLERIADFFAAHPDVAGANGHTLADGINTAGISAAEARALVDAHDAKAAPPLEIGADMDGLYGCNMAYRVAAIGGLRFDERLKLYGWQEDIDFAAQVRGRGRVVKTKAFAGVHQGVKHGRTPGLRLGYSQIINPLYLVRKGTMHRKYARKIILNNFAANHLKMFRPEPWVDRAGRARGNWLGLFDWIRGRLTPERIERL